MPDPKRVPAKRGGVVQTSGEPTQSEQVVFQVRNLTKVYDMGEVQVHALRGVDLELYEGELAVLLGASGSGKSTLMNIIGGLDTATGGTVLYKGDNLTHAEQNDLTLYRRQHVGFIFQFYNLIPSLTALENIQIVTEIAENPMDPMEALELVELVDRKDHFPAQLSGGQQQRVAIARAVAKQPDVLLCDEPTGALDSETGVLVLKALERINRLIGTTTLVITHNVAQAAMAGRVIYLKDGSVDRIEHNREPVDPEEITW